MKMRILIIATLLTVPFPVCAFDEWDVVDYGLEGIWAAFYCADWYQTRNFTQDEGTGYYERQTFLGEHPSRGKVDAFFAINLVAHPVVSHILPKKIEVLGFDIYPRNIWQTSSISISSRAVYLNWRNDVRIPYN